MPITLSVLIGRSLGAWEERAISMGLQRKLQRIQVSFIISLK